MLDFEISKMEGRGIRRKIQEKLYLWLVFSVDFSQGYEATDVHFIAVYFTVVIWLAFVKHVLCGTEMIAWSEIVR
jgi:hypothetical protein